MVHSQSQVGSVCFSSARSWAQPVLWRASAFCWSPARNEAFVVANPPVESQGYRRGCSCPSGSRSNRLIAIAAVLLALNACGTDLELTTTQSVDVLLLPHRLGTDGQKRVGFLPSGVTVPIKDSVLAKDGTAYEVVYLAPSSKARIEGYVLLSSPGLKVRKRS